MRKLGTGEACHARPGGLERIDQPTGYLLNSHGSDIPAATCGREDAAGSAWPPSWLSPEYVPGRWHLDWDKRSGPRGNGAVRQPTEQAAVDPRTEKLRFNAC